MARGWVMALLMFMMTTQQEPKHAMKGKKKNGGDKKEIGDPSEPFFPPH